jgi:large repetitive protein
MIKKYLVFVLLCFICFSAFAQPTVLYSSINTTARVAMTDLGLFKQGRMQANQSGFQRWAFHIGTVASPDYSQNWRIGSTPNVLSYGNFIPIGFSNGANYFSGGAGIDGELNAVVSGNYYTFNIMKNGAATSDMELLETNFNPTIISTVTQAPAAASVIANTSVAVTITMASAPAVGEYVYLRYSTDGYANSSLIQANFTGSVSTVNIPCQVAGTNLSYYVFSSNETLVGINSDLVAFGVNCYDMATLNLNNNGGPNYSYTVAAPSTNTISYAGTPYCSNSGIANVTNTGTLGGVYSSTAGLSINATTGAINLASSTAGTYTVTYTIAPTGSCALYSTTTPITITAAPAATISYAGSPYCSNVATATVTRIGTTGGVYSSTTGLSINATTGAVTLATSIAGTYTVTYTIAAAGGCALFATTTSITITTAPAATITYGAAPYCSNSGTATVTRTGTSGGVYSSTAGLSINATTGAVTLTTSTAGTYTVTYTVAAAGGCATFTTTAPITITTASNAIINYTGSPYCQAATTATVTRTGNAGGVYSSSTGLVLNATTGDVDLAASTAGTYVVTYTIAANAGCAVFTTTANITINSISVIPTSATANTTLICATSGTVTLTANGGTLGAGASYKWYSGSCGGTLVGTGAILTNVAIITTKTYFVRIEGICNTTACQSVTVNVAPQPVVEISIARSTGVTPATPVTIIATVSPAGTYNYLWTKNNTTNLSINADRIIVSADEAGNYKVKVTAASGCTATSVSAFVASAASNTMFIMPNPNRGIFNVSYNNGASNLLGRTLNIYDSKGARVFTQTYNNNVPFSNMKVDISGKGKGTYFVELIDATGKKLATGKVLVL